MILNYKLLELDMDGKLLNSQKKFRRKLSTRNLRRHFNKAQPCRTCKPLRITQADTFMLKNFFGRNDFEI